MTGGYKHHCIECRRLLKWNEGFQCSHCRKTNIYEGSKMDRFTEAAERLLKQQARYNTLKQAGAIDEALFEEMIDTCCTISEIKLQEPSKLYQHVQEVAAAKVGERRDYIKEASMRNAAAILKLWDSDALLGEGVQTEMDLIVKLAKQLAETLADEVLP